MSDFVFKLRVEMRDGNLTEANLWTISVAHFFFLEFEQKRGHIYVTVDLF